MDDKTFEKFVDRLVLAPDGCWLWTSYTGGKGYAVIRTPTGHLKMHREAYEHFVGPIPDGLTLDHLCRVRHCVNPTHLEPVTLVENVMRGESPHARNARKTHCKRGHVFDESNTGQQGKGWRRCRACGREDMRRYRAEKRQATA